MDSRSRSFVSPLGFNFSNNEVLMLKGNFSSRNIRRVWEESER